MTYLYRLAAQDLVFQQHVPSLVCFESDRKHIEVSVTPIGADHENGKADVIVAEAWIGGQRHEVQALRKGGDVLIRVIGVGGFFIDTAHGVIGSTDDAGVLTQQQNEALAGFVLVQALALRNVWSLHTSAVFFRGKGITFLGESGRGKSTLAAYLSQNTGWQLVADDILPIKGDMSGLMACPHFPQLKLPPDAQPAIRMPEQLPLDLIFELMPAPPDALPQIKKITAEQSKAQILLSHTAGTRLFDEVLLAKHLAFCAQAAEQIPVYQLIYPHSREALPRVKELLESLC